MEGDSRNVAESTSVLMTDKDLKRAVKDTTEDGRKPLDGIFTDDGKRVERPPADQEVGDSRVAQVEHQKMVALAGLTKNYKDAKKKEKKLAKKQGVNEEALTDKRQRKKAERALESFTESERIQYEELFKAFDKDGDRNWGSIEFAQGMSDIGIPTSVEASANLLYFAGVKDVDRITYEDFLVIMPKLKAFRVLIEKEVMKKFQLKDTGHGYITTAHLREMIEDLAGRGVLSHHQIEAIVKKADRRREGQVNFAEVIVALFGSKPQIEYVTPERHKSIVNVVKSTMVGWMRDLCGTAIEEDLDMYFDDPEMRERDRGSEVGSNVSGSPTPSPPDSPRSL